MQLDNSQAREEIWEEEYYKFIKPGIFTNVVFWNSENILKSPIIGKTTDDTNIYDFCLPIITSKI